ncbi:hypothetical protein D3C77_694300 [compost metagenome]
MLDDPVHEPTDECIVVLGNVVQVTRIHDDCPLQWGQLLEQIDDLLEVGLVAPVQVSAALDACGSLLGRRVHKATIVHHLTEFLVRLALHQREDVGYRYLG